MEGRPRHFAATVEQPPQEDEVAYKGVRAVAIACIVAFGIEGLYLCLTRPAIRVVGLTLASLASAVALWVVSARVERRGRDAEFFSRRVFPVLFCLLGILYALFFPPATIPDELYHYGHTYAYANLLDPTYDQQSIRREDYVFTRNQKLYDSWVDDEFWVLQRQLPLFSTHEGRMLDTSVVKGLKFSTNPPQLRVCAALGVIVARALNLSGVALYYLGRLFNFLFAFALIVAAVRLVPVGKNAFMTVSLLPMTLHLLGSYSYDAGIIGMAFLLSALVLRTLLGEGRAPARLLVADVLVACLLAPCKVVYYPIALLGLLTNAGRFASRRQELAWKASMVVLPFGAIMLFRRATFATMAGTGSEPNIVAIKSSTTPGYTLKDVLAHPWESFLMLLRTFDVKTDFYLWSLVGSSLAWFQDNIVARNWQVLILFAALLFAALPATDDAGVLPGRLRVACAVLCMVVFFAVLASMLFGWTLVNEIVIEGVQGRYFLPVLPLGLLALRGNAIVVRRGLSAPLLLVLTSLSFIYLAHIAYWAMGGPLIA